MLCSECGTKLNVDAKACSMCGNRELGNAGVSMQNNRKPSLKPFLILIAIMVLMLIGVIAKDYLLKDEVKEEKTEETKKDEEKTEEDLDNYTHYLNLNEETTLIEEDFEVSEIWNFDEVLTVINVEGFGTFKGLRSKTSDYMETLVTINDIELGLLDARPIKMQVVGDILHVQYHDSFDLCCSQISAYYKDGEELYSYKFIDNGNFYINVEKEIEIKPNNDIVIGGSRIAHGAIFQNNEWLNNADVCLKDSWTQNQITGDSPSSAKYEIKYLGNYRFANPVQIEVTQTFNQSHDEMGCN